MQITSQAPTKTNAVVNGLSIRRKMTVKEGKGHFDVIISRFESPAEYYERIENNISERTRSEVEVHMTPRFLGRCDLNNLFDVKQARQKPDNELLKIVDKKVELLEGELPEPTQIKRCRKFDEFDGDEIDCDRLRSGQEFWQATDKQSSTGIQNVIINIQQNASGGTLSSQIANRCATAIALAKKLESAGYGVEINVFNYNSNVFEYAPYDKNRLLTIIPAKQFDQLLDMVSLTNLTAPWMFRSYTFADRSITGQMFGDRATRGMGQTLEIDDFAIEEINNGIDKTTTMVINFGKRCLEKQIALDTAKNAIRELEPELV